MPRTLISDMLPHDEALEYLRGLTNQKDYYVTVWRILEGYPEYTRVSYGTYYREWLQHPDKDIKDVFSLIAQYPKGYLFSIRYTEY